MPESIPKIFLSALDSHGNLNLQTIVSNVDKLLTASPCTFRAVGYPSLGQSGSPGKTAIPAAGCSCYNTYKTIGNCLSSILNVHP